MCRSIGVADEVSSSPPTHRDVLVSTETCTGATAKATDVAGVHRLPDGAAYYEWALRLGTSTNSSAGTVSGAGAGGGGGAAGST